MKAVYDAKTNWKNVVPFRWMGGTPKISRACSISDCHGAQGVFQLSTVGLFKSFYEITFGGRKLNGYVLSKGDANYVVLYDAEKEKQVGLLVKSLQVDNHLDTYKLYLLDHANCDPFVLSLFVVYYDNWNYGHQGEFALAKREVSREWTLSRYHKKYDPSWLAKHFPLLGCSDPPDFSGEDKN
ncbi:MAG: hypothetical protein BGN88_03730 [Clostridiales bacterium 43-6]|nr:MAG: hypothetical protein BGN88_03730 [Clostridiales bacterium 43-6]